MNQDNRPCTRKRYRTWLQRPNPIAPRSTASRLRLLNERNIAEPINVHAVAENVQPPAHNNNVQPMDANNAVNDGFDNGSGFDSDSDHSEVLGSSSAQSSVASPSSSWDSSFSDTDGSQSPSDEAGINHLSDQNDVAEEHDEELADDWEPTRYPDLDEELFHNVECSKFECLLMIMTFSLRHGLTQVATEDLCKLVNKMFGGNVIPTSSYLFKKIFGKYHFTYHFYCSTQNCGAYVGNILSSARREGTLRCTVCEKQFSISTMNKGCFFITFPIEDQLRFLLQNTDNVLDLLQYRWTRETEPDVISDIFDGEIYKNLSAAGGFLSEKFNLSITANTDGAVVFESTKNTLYPIHIRVNEFAPHIRFNQSKGLVCGLWFANKEPSMHLFLSTFVREMQSLYDHGFTWKAPNGQSIRSKVLVLNCVFDSKCKPVVQSVKSFNGYYGCGYCLHPAVVFEGTSTAKYPMNDDIALLEDNSCSYTVTRFERVNGEMRTYQVEDRNNDGMRSDMTLAESLRNAEGEGPDVKGVKGKSVLYDIRYLDMVFGFSIDYLHAVLLGVTRLVTGLWFDTSSKDDLYYLNADKLLEVDNRLLNIKPPTSISRRPRTLEERKNWHGNEWRSWLLYYSLPCLEGILPVQYLKHHCVLVSAIYTLLQDRISLAELQEASWYLSQYCVAFSILYWPANMNYNVHLLLHLGKGVKLGGPLFTYSCFSFEGANGILVKLVKGSKGVMTQIADKYLRSLVLPKILTLYNVRDTFIEYCEDLMCYRVVKHSNKYETVTVLGTERNVPLSAEENQIFTASGVPATPWTYERMIKKKILFHAKCYVRGGSKSNNSIVKLNDGSYGVLQRIISPRHFQEQNVKVMIRSINLEQNSYITRHQSGAKAAHIKKCSLITYGDLIFLDVSAVSQKSILLECGDNNYITDFPNIFEKD